MKTSNKVLILVLAFSVLLTGCNLSGSNSDMTIEEYSDTWSDSQAAEAKSISGEIEVQEVPDTAILTVDSSSVIVPDKMIFTASSTVETLDFDQSVGQVNSMVSEYGGFVESSSVTGISTFNTYYGHASSRTATYTIRIPNDKFSGLSDTLKNIGNVIEYNTQAKNVTSEYTDLEARLATYETQQERLLSMLEQAESIEDMLKTEERLTQVIYNIESLTSSIKGLDNQISYSTLNLSIEEVEKITETEKTEQVGYWEDVTAALSVTLTGTASFFKALLKYLIAAMPVITIILAAAVLIFIIRRIARRKRNTDINIKDGAQYTDNTSEADKNKDDE